MLKRQSKVLSIALIFVFCMSFMFAGFAAPNAAQAVPVVSKANAQTFDPVIVEFPVLNAGYHRACVKLPDNFTVNLNAVGQRISNLSDTGGPFDGLADVNPLAAGTAAQYSALVNTPGGVGFAAGDTVTVAGRTYTAIAAGPAGAMQFVATGADVADATALAAAIAADANNPWTATDAAGTITLTQRVAAPVTTVPNFTTTGTGTIATPSTLVTPYVIGANGIRVTGLSANNIQLEIQNPAVLQKVKIAVLLNSVDVPNGAEAEINATLIRLDGAFTDAIIPVARTTSGALDLIRTDPPTMTAGNSPVFPAPGSLTIQVREDSVGALVQGADTLKLKLPRGVTWTAAPIVRLFPGSVALPNAAAVGGETITATIADPSEARFTRTTTGGAASIAGKYTFTIIGQVYIDEEEAEFGDINVTALGRSTINNSTIKIGTYKDFGYKVTAEKPDTQLIAGRANQQISTITIEENIRASLLAGRQVYMTLPDGVEWSDTVNRVVPAYGACTINGTNLQGGLNLTLNRSANDQAKIHGAIINPGGAAKGKMELKNVEVDVAPDFTGPIEVTFHGSAGINETVKVGEAVSPVKASAKMENVIIGKQTQKAGDIVIAETMVEGILAVQAQRFAGAGSTFLSLAAPAGVEWAKVPTVTVSKGDLKIGTVRTNWDAARRIHSLDIEIRNSSRTATELTITDVFYTVDRTVPEGNLEIDVTGRAVDQSWSNQFVNRNAVSTFTAATVVTPAPGETIGNGEFRIGSNIYYVGGVAKVMDVAPYIKGDRTYVPMRYLGEILGAEVVWDDAARTATLTKGDDVVVFTIGSTTYTVNGESKTADVAPEITNSRTMLPARYVAEAFGAVVGWDQSTRTVLIQK